jgi:hypothetical protein
MEYGVLRPWIFHFEDAIQILCASSITRIDFIVTRNTKDFKTSEIAVLTPDEMCLKL